MATANGRLVRDRDSRWREGAGKPELPYGNPVSDAGRPARAGFGRLRGSLFEPGAAGRFPMRSSCR